jgi:hypothetical protein
LSIALFKLYSLRKFTYHQIQFRVDIATSSIDP